jgi:hypothetical protein
MCFFDVPNKLGRPRPRPLTNNIIGIAMTTPTLSVVVLGPTGAGKTTLLNRLLTPLDEPRMHFFREGAGTSPETKEAVECDAFFFGNRRCPVKVVDMPGSHGGTEEETRHLRSCAEFLMTRPDPVAHLFVLVVNATSPRMHSSLQNMLSVFKKVYDPDGSKGFINYLSVVFTHMK